MMETEVKKEVERIKGRYTVIAAVITTLGVVASAVIGFYAVVVPLKEQNDTLQQKNEELAETSQESQGETSAMQDNISALEKRISELEGTIAELRDENTNLKNQYDTVQANYTSAVNEIDTLKEENKQLKEQISSAPVSNGFTQLETVSQSPSQGGKSGQSFLEVCPPYETADYEAPDRVSVMGDNYKNSFMLKSVSGQSYAFFNLKKQYQTFEFDVGHVDGLYMYARNLRIMLDNESFQEPYILQPNMMLTHFSIPVSGISQMRIYVEQGEHQSIGSSPASYAFVNMKLS